VCAGLGSARIAIDGIDHNGRNSSLFRPAITD
jgi:hypothetical protein